jgi:hypothetical protein
MLRASFYVLHIDYSLRASAYCGTLATYRLFVTSCSILITFTSYLPHTNTYLLPITPYPLLLLLLLLLLPTHTTR